MLNAAGVLGGAGVTMRACMTTGQRVGDDADASVRTEDHILRVAGSLSTGTVRASELLRVLGSVSSCAC
jgi:hypothetical protein